MRVRPHWRAGTRKRGAPAVTGPMRARATHGGVRGGRRTGSETGREARALYRYALHVPGEKPRRTGVDAAPQALLGATHTWRGYIG